MNFVYVLLCGDGKIYTGFTHNIKKRIFEHKNGLSKTTKIRLPVKVLWIGIFKNEKLAILFEKYLKSSSEKAFSNKHLI
ncbi:MAG TPA: GIY-YIG nuclease family protein [Candidatus Nanoarchaeia archaeon]|nr:GIY-YIG nuclease family protein [Candidatus Nanoarchaeia archaeon]